MPARIKKAKISHISLCQKGKNQLPVIYKEDGAFDLSLLTKAGDNFDDKGELLCCVYAPELRDSDGHVADAEVIKDMAHDFAKNGKGIDIRHDGQTLAKDKAYPVESFIIQKGDPRFADMKTYDDKPVDVAGGWGMVVKIDDPALRKQYREGKWNGVSMGGHGLLEPEADGQVLKFLKSLGQALGLSASKPEPGDTMTAAEIQKAIADGNAALLAGLTAVFTKAGVIKAEEPKAEPKAKDEAPEAPKAPVFKGDPSNPEEVAAHSEALARFNLAKGVNWSDPASVDAYHKKLTAFQANKGDDTPEGCQPTDSPQVKALQRQINEMRKSSNAPQSNGSAGGDDSNLDGPFQFDKSQQAGMSRGNAMATFINKTAGYA